MDGSPPAPEVKDYLEYLVSQIEALLRLSEDAALATIKGKHSKQCFLGNVTNRMCYSQILLNSSFNVTLCSIRVSQLGKQQPEKLCLPPIMPQGYHAGPVISAVRHIPAPDTLVSIPVRGEQISCIERMKIGGMKCTKYVLVLFRVLRVN
jgi:hypothetical protein